MSGPEEQPDPLSDALEYCDRQKRVIEGKDRVIKKLDTLVKTLRAEISELTKRSSNGGIQITTIYGIPFDHFSALIDEIEMEAAGSASDVLAAAFKSKERVARLELFIESHCDDEAQANNGPDACDAQEDKRCEFTKEARVLLPKIPAWTQEIV